MEQGAGFRRIGAGWGWPVAAALAVAVAAAVVAGYAGAAGITYTPQTRNLLVTMVPLQVHEMEGVLPYLKKDFAKGGLLEDKEVYGMVPGTLVVYQGDTVHLTIVNPADDPHTLAAADLHFTISVQGQSKATGTFVANKVGTFWFGCVIPEHAPYMWGQIVVLPDRDAR